MEPVKIKTVLSILLISSGALMVALVGTGYSASAYQATGIIIDFGNRDVVWTETDTELYNDPIGALEFACEKNGLSLTVIDGIVVEINGISPDDDYTWDLWIVPQGGMEWIKIGFPYDVDLKDQVTSAWAYCNESETPTVGIDQAGRSIYGYSAADRNVSLSPSITEIFGALNAVTTLVGTDRYSNYPSSVVDGQGRGDIALVGGYTDPSYELIIKTSPDIVFCDGSQYGHYDVSERLRNSGIATVMMYRGESIDTILDNIFIIGAVLGYDLRAFSVITSLENAIKDIVNAIISAQTNVVDAMFALSPDKAPWVSGSDTYIDNITNIAFGNNVMSSIYPGWFHTNSEIILEKNPSLIIIVSGDYRATASEYETMLRYLSEEWKKTTAYIEENIYMLCDSLGEMASRPGPRFAQLLELVAMMLHPQAFDIELPKFIGDNYEDYLTYTKYLGFAT